MWSCSRLLVITTVCLATGANIWGPEMTILLLHVPPPTTTILLSYSSSPRSTTRTFHLTRRLRCRVSNSSEVVPIPNISLCIHTYIHTCVIQNPCMILRLNRSTGQEFLTISSCNRSGTNWWRWVLRKLGGCSWHLIRLMFYFLFMFQVMWITGSRVGFRQTWLRWSYWVGEASLVEKSH